MSTIPNYRYSEAKTKVEPGESVVVVRQRFNITPEAVVEHLKHGQLIVGEWDDDPWYEGFNGKLKTPSVEWALKACHTIQVSTEAIAELVRPINPNVVVIRNHVAAVGPKREHAASDVIRIYMGGQRLKGDWDDTLPTVNQVVAADPNLFHFVVVHDRELYDALESKHKTFYAFQPYDKYRSLLRTCDAAIISLGDSRLNRCKSDITEIECAAEGTMALVAQSSEFTNMFRRWKHIFLTPDQFAQRLHEDGERNRKWVAANRMLGHHYRWRGELFGFWLDRKPELDRQLFERLPELKEVVG